MKDNNHIEIKTTADGSDTLYIPSMDETYHSTHGAIQEAKHVFIRNGIELIEKAEVKVLEVGFGTGLNACLTQIYSETSKKKIDYTGLESMPLNSELITKLNYRKEEPELENSVFDLIHNSAWGLYNSISKNFNLKKLNVKVQDYDSEEKFDVIYYDAFGPRAQIEMWEKEIFESLYLRLNEGGLLTTYCAMGQFKRDLKSIGFTVKSLPGPPGKREMTLAIK